MKKLLTGMLLLCSSIYGQSEPRIILACFDGNQYTGIEKLPAEVPLNHLGFILKYHDIHKGIPKIKNWDSIYAILTWNIGQTEGLISFIKEALDRDKKLIIWGDNGFSKNAEESADIWEHLGFTLTNNWVGDTTDAKIAYLNPEIMNFERELKGPLPDFNQTKASERATSYLKIQHDNIESPLVITSDHGGYVSSAYGLYENNIGPFSYWYLDPFRYFRTVLQSEERPVPDTTTLNGRRIYYHHIDGDGWNNISKVKISEKSEPITCAEVFLERVFKKYSHLPVTAGLIAAEVDLEWFGTKEAIERAKIMYALPQVEVGCHTFTHPFDWQFFLNYQPEEELPYLKFYSRKPRGDWAKYKPSDAKAKLLNPGYLTPRAYALKPFDLKMEIDGAIKEIDSLAPKNKPVALYQWSGDTLVSSEAIKLTEAAGVQNINGPGSRFDNTFNSYSWLKPLANVCDGNAIQVFCSGSNEMYYTDDWHSHFYAFATVTATFDCTETPIRIKPINVYNHFLSAESYVSLYAFESLLEYATQHEIIPIKASLFSKIVNGFFSTQLEKMGPKTWRISNRGELQTIRFDNATLLTVDFEKSKGVLGQRHFQGCLYVHLDSQVPECEIALKNNDEYYQEPSSLHPYLIQSNWKIWNLNRDSEKLTVQAEGYGEGEMLWRVPEKLETFLVEAFGDDHRLLFSDTIKSEDGMLALFIKASAITPIQLTIQRIPHE